MVTTYPHQIIFVLGLFILCVKTWTKICTNLCVELCNERGNHKKIHEKRKKIVNKQQKCVNIPQPSVDKHQKLLSLTSWRIRLKCTSCFLKQATSCSIELRNVLSTTRSSDDELSSCDWRFSCCRCFRCSRRDVFEGVLRLWRLSRERGLSEPFWLSGELLVFWNRRLRRRVARAGSWDLQRKKIELSKGKLISRRFFDNFYYCLKLRTTPLS